MGALPKALRDTTTDRRWIGLRLLLVVALVMLTVCLPAARASLSSAPDKDWVTNGPVNALARSGNTIYLGGSFSRIGPRTGPAVTFSGGSSAPDASFPEVSGGSVRTAISDGSGGWYLGGGFTHVGGAARAGLAHVLAGGTVDPNFAPSIEGIAHGASVFTLALSGSTLYVGGGFFGINGEGRTGLAAIKTTDGSLESWNPATPSNIYALMVNEGTLYVGGSFAEMAGHPRENLAAFKTANGELTSWAPQAHAITNGSIAIASLAAQGTTIYAAGAFDQVNGAERSGFAALDSTGSLTTWNPAAGGCNNEPTLGVGSALVATPSTIYIGGCFTTVGGQSRHSLAAVDPTTAAATTWNPGIGQEGFTSSRISDLAVSGSTLYVVGAFSEAGGAARNGAVALDAISGSATAWNPNTDAGTFTSEVETVATEGSSVFLGGSFASVGSVERHNAAAIDLSSGEATGWNPNADQPVNALAVASGAVYAGGSFGRIGGQIRPRLAALDPATGTATSWVPASLGGSDSLKALLISGSTVYVGGTAGAPQGYLGAFNTTTGSATGWNPAITTRSFGDGVFSLAQLGSTIYVGGDFSTLGGQNRSSLGAVDATTGVVTSWNPLPTPNYGGGQSDPEIHSLLIAGGVAYTTGTVTGTFDATSGATKASYVGGVITVAGSSAFTGLGQAFDVNSGIPYAWNPQLIGFTPSTKAVLVAGSKVVVGGSFTTSEPAAVQGIAVYSITGPVNTASPTIQGTAAEGQTLTAHPGSWTGSPTSTAYQWLRCDPPRGIFSGSCHPISGATGQAYVPTAADNEASIEVAETATNAGGASDPVASIGTAFLVAPPINTAAPIIAGTPTVGQALTCSTGNWSGSPTSYQYAWTSEGTPIFGAASSTYLVSPSDIGHELSCGVTAVGPGGNSSPAYAFAGPVAAGETGGGGGTDGGGSGGGGSSGGDTGGNGSSSGGSGLPGTDGPDRGPDPSAGVAAIQEALTTLLNLKGPLPTVAGLLKTGSYSLSFAAPRPGVLTIRWTVANAQASRHARHKAKPVVIATGSETFTAIGPGIVKVRLTPAGRKLLSKSRTLQVVDQATFTLSGGAAQTKQAALTIRPGKRSGHH